MRSFNHGSKVQLAKSLGVSRASLYYVSLKDQRDWNLKTKIELELRDNPSYGSRRLAWALGYNRKRLQRVMRRFGIKPYRRRGRKWRKKEKIIHIYQNLLLMTIPSFEHHVWASDFTELKWLSKKIYVATILDLFTRKIVGLAVALRKGTPLVTQALWSALLYYPRPEIFHSDNGKEYDAKAFVSMLVACGIRISRSHPGCPWENGYQESWYDKFKIDLGDPSRFDTLGEMVAEIYRAVWSYNHTRIHSALKMPPDIFAIQQKTALQEPLKSLRISV